MNIVKENKDALNATLTIHVEPSDYSPLVDSSLKKVQKNASMAGFRPGKVPSGMLRKMYGKSILADELNKLLNDSLYSYLEDNKVTYLGNPIPKNNGQEAGDWENPGKFEFHYELGLAPEFEFTISPKEKFDYFTVEITDKMVEDYLNDLRRSYGKYSSPETSEATDILYGEFTELNENGEPKENGITTTTTLGLEFIKDEKERALFLGKHKDETIVFSPKTTINNASEVAAMFKISKEVAETLDSKFRFVISTVNRIEKADMNVEFFEKVLPGVTTEEEFRVKIKERIASQFTPDSDHYLREEIRDRLIAQTNLPLPDDFLKRWMQTASEKPVTMEQVESEFPIHAKQIRWQLIVGKILKDRNDISVTKEELESYARESVFNQFSRYGIRNIEPEKLHAYAGELLKKDTEVRRMTNEIIDYKVYQLLKESYTLNTKVMSYEDFVKMHENHQHS